ncbi:MAG: TonB family protein [Deltaproteobacteria bacterium]|nr:TonB family protein [Deltaproteobacteria bacterium]
MTQSKVEVTVVVRDAAGKEKPYTFTKSGFLIGRAVSCDVPLEETAAGKEHARIEVSPEGAVRLRDLGTSTGTYLHGNRISESILLSDGDELKVGDTTLLIRVKKAAEAPAPRAAAREGAKWKAYELAHKPVLNIAQMWGDAVIAVNRFGKSSKHVIHSIVFVLSLLLVEFWFTWEYYASLRGFYLAGKMADYGPALMAVILCFLITDILIFIMVKDLFLWPRESQFKSVRVGRSDKADFFVPEELLGKKDYNLIVSYRNKPALNLESDAVRGRIMMEGQILPVEEIKKTSFMREKYLLPLDYKTRARLEIGHITFILGLDPSLREPRGGLVGEINVPFLSSFGLAFFLNALFLLALMAAPRTERVVKLASSHSRSFKTLIKAEKRKKEDDDKKKVDLEKEKKKEEKKEEEKKEEDNPLKDEEEKDPLLEEKVEEKRVVTKKLTFTPAEKKSLLSDLKTKTEKKKLSSMSTPVSKDKVRQTGALAALNNAGMKVVGSNFGAGGMDIDSSFQPVGDLAISGLGAGGMELGGSADSDPFDLSAVAGSGIGLDGEGGATAGGFSGTVGADGAAMRGDNLISGKEFEELDKKRVSSSVKNPTFKDKAVKITPAANFDMSGGGKLDREVVKNYIRKQLAKIRWCYQKAFQKNPELEGKLTVSFVISPTGSVMSAKVINSSLGDKELEGCVEQKIMTWKFPAPQGGGVVKVNYPFVLRKQ